jgi:hypothetical protein
MWDFFAQSIAARFPGRHPGTPPAVYLRQKKDDSYARRRNGFSKSFAGQSGVE